MRRAWHGSSSPPSRRRSRSASTTDDISDGAVTIDKVASVPALSVYTSAAQAVPAATTTRIDFLLFDFVTGDTSLVFDPVAYRVNVRRTGLYRVTVRAAVTPAAAGGGRVSAIVRRNGAEVAEAGAPALLGVPTVACVTTLLACQAGDFVEGCVLQTTPGAQALMTASGRRAQLQIEYVGGL